MRYIAAIFPKAVHRDLQSQHNFQKKNKKKTLEQAYNLSFAISFYQKLKMFSEAKLYSINK